MNITLLGCGRWGSFIGWYLDKIGHNVTIWGLTDAPQFIELRDTRKNNMLTFRDSIHITDDLTQAVTDADILIISISAQALRSFLPSLQAYDLTQKKIVLCMKGIEVKTGKRLTEIVEEFVPAETQIAVWVGPGHPQDFSKGIPNCMVLDSRYEDLRYFLIKQFSSELIRFYVGNDLIGTEIGAAAKNTIGIAAGMLDGLNLSSLKGALMSRGTREIARLIKAMGGNELSAYGLCHLGDYEATLFSQHSHNRRFGEMLVKGEKFGLLAEGVDTTKALVYLGEKYCVDLPICKTVNQVISGEITAERGLSDLFLRSIKTEF
ncbi:MAG: NAD(P)H-dependent glycerol-3-phosphate dehydrogenase [Acutalibacteraceae bacterium]|nr:NAD(P)H-dependent glycerol-3-phosphate dehydrogenase [Clostridia bacterium]MEE3404603.1 NAD(P)H-dependent glycerol-3-phosphate dehydrogenase [Acutalibacteraceae bacterium]HCA54800.1 glycerol-3-phosphate dehydrogenase [Oscillospiraceae bacterium]